MSRLWVIGLTFIFFTRFALGQEPATVPTASSSHDEQTVRVRIYAPGPGVVAPELLPINVPFMPPLECMEKVDGTVRFAVVVDATGRPRNVMFLHPLANDLDRLALQIVGADRFKSGTHDGTPVAVGQSLEVKIQSCVEEREGSEGKKIYSLRMRSLPEQKLEPPQKMPDEAVLSTADIPWIVSVSPAPHADFHAPTTPPVTLNTVTAQYTEEARKARLNGVCMVSLIVDPQGMPQKIRLVRGIDPGLDQNALIAVGKYRFKPAIRDGEPVAVTIFVEVIFRMV
jgi:TonB family protein